MLPLAFFPTTTIFIDDNETFLKSMRTKASHDKMNYMLFSKPKNAINYLDSAYNSNHYLDRYIKNIAETSYEHRAIEIEVYKIHQEIYNPTRFRQVSTVVVDYSMPSMNGLEVCKSIKDPYIQKILLTGMADEEIAIEAFNAGIINKYIRKDDFYLIENLQQALDDSQQAYFDLISRDITRLVIREDWRQSAIDDPQFAELVNEIIKQYNIVEYYIIETIGCYLFVDATGRHYGLFLADEGTMDTMSREADYPDSEESPKVIEALKNREKILCYHDKHSVTLPHVDYWHHYLHTANRLEGKETYYWAFVPSTIDLYLDKVLPFRTYKRDNMRTATNLVV